MPTQPATAPYALISIEDGQARKVSDEAKVAALACAAAERWATSGRRFSPSCLATSFAAECDATPWLSQWWVLYFAIARRHYRSLVAIKAS